jgi:hypothetical protein
MSQSIDPIGDRLAMLTETLSLLSLGTLTALAPRPRQD